MTPFSLPNLQASAAACIASAQVETGNALATLKVVSQPLYSESNWLALEMHGETPEPVILVVTQPTGWRWDKARNADVNQIEVDVVVNPKLNDEQEERDPWAIVEAVKLALHEKPERSDYLRFEKAGGSVDDIDGLLVFRNYFTADTFTDDV